MKGTQDDGRGLAARLPDLSPRVVDVARSLPLRAHLREGVDDGMASEMRNTKSDRSERHPLIGYFTAPEQTEPAHDPPHDGPCLVCWQALTPEDVRTISVMPYEVLPGRASLFFRVHRSCDEADPDAAIAIEHAVIDGEYDRLEASRG